MYHNVFIHLSVDGHLGCFHVLAIVNSATMNTGVHLSFAIFFFLRNMPRSSIDGSSGGFSLSLLRNLGKGNGKPLQYSCLENPMDGGAW